MPVLVKDEAFDVSAVGGEDDFMSMPRSGDGEAVGLNVGSPERMLLT